MQLLKFGTDQQFHPTLYDGFNNLSMLGLKKTMLVKGATDIYMQESICGQDILFADIICI